MSFLLNDSPFILPKVCYSSRSTSDLTLERQRDRDHTRFKRTQNTIIHHVTVRSNQYNASLKVDDVIIIRFPLTLLLSLLAIAMDSWMTKYYLPLIRKADERAAVQLKMPLFETGIGFLDEYGSISRLCNTFIKQNSDNLKQIWLDVSRDFSVSPKVYSPSLYDIIFAIFLTCDAKDNRSWDLIKGQVPMYIMTHSQNHTFLSISHLHIESVVGATSRQRHLPTTYARDRNHVHLQTHLVSDLFDLHDGLGLPVCSHQCHCQQKVHESERQWPKPCHL